MQVMVMEVDIQLVQNYSSIMYSLPRIENFQFLQRVDTGQKSFDSSASEASMFQPDCGNVVE